MPEHNRVLFSQRCRTLAEECWLKAQSFHDDDLRNRMLQLAEDYVRKARQAEELEATLEVPPVEAPSLIPKIAENFVNRMKADSTTARRPKAARKRRARKPGGKTRSKPA